MKKLLSILIILTMVFVLFGCSNNTGTGNSGDNSQTQGSQTAGTNSGNTNPPTSSGGGSGSGNTNPSGEITNQGAVEILSSYGDLETAVVTWKPDDNTGYVVYEKEDNTSYKKVDNQLIRRYSDYFRVDVLGLKKGKHDIKVVPVIGGKEDDGKSTSISVEVNAHKREGFAFSKSSPNKTGSGAYNDDGTLKSGAKVLYITKDNFNTITLDVIKDSKGKTQTGTGLLDIMYLRGKGYDKTPLAVRFIGQIKDTDITWETANVKADEYNYVSVKGTYNVTFEGVGSDATCYGWSLKVRDANNVEVRNFGFMLFKDDGVTMDTDNFNIWVHNNDFFYGAPGSDSDQVKGDGSCDNKKSNYLTISYNHFWDSGKSILCGMGDTTEYFATFHHNWFDHSDSRHPRIRVGTIHVYNNFYDGVSKYCIGATTGSSCFAESNYFLNSKKPILSSRQGTDAQGEGTFSGEDGGIVKSFGHVYSGSSTPIDYSANNTSFDCYEVKSAKETVPSTVKTLQGGTTYNNFDTQSTMYAYVADDANNVPDIVKAFAGRVSGGDFKWTFTSSDNTSYNIINELKTAIANYKTSLIYIGGI